MRRDDPNDDKIWLRSDRIFYRDDGWYVATREGDLGPFRSLEMAVIGLDCLTGSNFRSRPPLPPSTTQS